MGEHCEGASVVPYIEDYKRDRAQDSPETPGELNYAITVLVREYVALFGLRYQTINDVLGALEGAKLEFYRRVAAPYEEMKRAQNGDVYT